MLEWTDPTKSPADPYWCITSLLTPITQNPHLPQVARIQPFQRLAFPPRLLSVTRNNHCMQKLAAILANSIAIMTHMLPKYTGRL